MDDSVDVEILQMISAMYPDVEWGVLLRPDMEGKPRYASAAYLRKLSAVAKESKQKGRPMHLAGHLCGSRCRDVLDGDADFVKHLVKLGFGRVQVNATAANGVDSSKLSEKVEHFRKAVVSVPDVEWILQMNEETKDLWTPFVKGSIAKNVSLLFDASCGKGILPSSFQPPHATISCGYAGGLGPANIVSVLQKLERILDDAGSSVGGGGIWTDMESSLREKRDGIDAFSITNAHRCAQAAASVGAIRRVTI